MILIADSGSTKTAWALAGKRGTVVTEGLNPHFSTDEAFLAACAEVRNRFGIKREGLAIHFYGAGCGSEVQRGRVRELLQKAFGTGNVEVETDMLGACRAVCGTEAGIVGILGTGSNACYYDGRAIVCQAFSTGWILGDEGSANHVGRHLLHGYLTGCMPPELQKRFASDYPLSNEQFMDKVYHEPHANRFLASLAPFALRNYRFAYCYFAVLDSLKLWYFHQLADLKCRFGCREVSIAGGFGAAIGKGTIEAFEEECKVKVVRRVADPVGGLVRYHSV